MPRMVLFTIATAMASVAVGLGAMSASADLLDDLNDTVNDVGGNLPGGGGDGHVDLPGGGGVDLPGSGGGGGVQLPGGGGSVPLTPPRADRSPRRQNLLRGARTGPGTSDPGGAAGGHGGGHSGDGSGGGSNEGADRPEPQSGREFARDGAPLRNPDGSPTDANPTLTVADFGPAPMGVPNFMIDQFSIPPFLLPIYQACGTQYSIPWQVLASINRIETAFGTNLNVSTAGAQGWMQFMPSTWDMYGVGRQQRRAQGPQQPGRRDLRRRPLPQRRRRRG